MTILFYTILLASSAIVSSLTIPSFDNIGPQAPEFRYDYTYDADTNSWLKLHNIPATWHAARYRCSLEGGQLASPLDQQLLNAMTAMMRNSPSAIDRVFTGIHASFSPDDYYSIKGYPLDRTPLVWNGNPSSDVNKRCIVLDATGHIINDKCTEAAYPYFCYKKNDFNSLNNCGTIDPDYTYNRDLHTCYKFHKTGKVWSQAFATCSAEGGHLVIIDDEKEYRAVIRLFNEYAPEDITSEDDSYVSIGVIDWQQTREWFTIHGDNIEDTGYSKWSPGEPNNANKSEFCGTLKRNGNLNDSSCKLKLAFICEKKPDSLLPVNAEGERKIIGY